MLAGRAEALAEMCVKSARGKVELLKSVVPKVAQREGVETDALANYMAYRLSLDGKNWWGAANNLQESGPLPWDSAREILFKRADLSSLNRLDKDLLLRAVSNDEEG